MPGHTQFSTFGDTDPRKRFRLPEPSDLIQSPDALATSLEAFGDGTADIEALLRVAPPRPPDPEAEKQTRRNLTIRQMVDTLDRQGVDFSALEAGMRRLGDNVPASALPLMSDVVRVGREIQSIRNIASIDRTARGILGGFGGGLLGTLTFGQAPIMEPEDIEGVEGRTTAAKIIGELLGMGFLAFLGIRTIGKFTAMPRVAPLWEGLSNRARDAIYGGLTGGLIDAARPEGIPEETASYDIPARIARFVEPVTGERLGLAVGGAVFGAGIDIILGPIVRGFVRAKETRMLEQLPDEVVAPIREALEQAGVQVESTATKAQLVRSLIANQERLVTPDAMVEIGARLDARFQYIAEELYSNPQFAANVENIEEAAIYAGALIKANPGGVSVARGVTEANVRRTSELLGIRISARQVGNDVIIARPPPPLSQPRQLAAQTKQVQRLVSIIKAENRGSAARPILNIFGSGRTTVGGFDAADVARQLKLEVPTVGGVPRPDLAVRQRVGVVQMEVASDGLEVTISIPSNITRRQLQEIGRQVDLHDLDRVIINPFKAGDEALVLHRPISLQVEDAIVGMLPGKAKRLRPTKQMVSQINQFAREGVFRGQAGVLDNGYAVEVIGKKGTNVRVKDPFLGDSFTVNEERIGMLPTSLEGSLTPNQLIDAALDPTERAIRAKLIRLARRDLINPIKTFDQLETFASARGYGVDALENGKVRIFDFASGEGKQYRTIKGASKALRELDGPILDVTPPELIEILGSNTNIGSIGIGAAPARFQERVHVPTIFNTEGLEETVKQFGMPGAVRKATTPTRGLLLDIERIHNVPVGRVFLAVQEQVIHRQNFMATWALGEGPGLPTGVMSLKRIQKMAGRGANQEVITHWLEAESDDVARLALETGMTRGEISAAKELRKWYNALYERFGVEARWLQDYAPHIRQQIDRYGSDMATLWRKTRGTSLPKGVDFFADSVRDGVLDVHEMRAFVAASQYAGAGSNARFMKEVLEDAREVLWRIPDNAVKAPLVSYLEAIRGTEFATQTAALTASVENMFRSLGMTPKAVSNISDRLVLNLIGLGYSATMEFRIGLAVRNLTQTMQTTWTLFGGTDDILAEAMGRAMTRAGRDQPILDGAISIRSKGLVFAEEAFETMPEGLRQMTNASMRLYQGADQWNRAVAYWTGRLRAEKAIGNFAKARQGGMDAVRAQRQLLKESGAYVFDKPVVDEFLRRMVQSPELGAKYIGVNAANVTQWLYGRGNQVWWMRTVPGRFAGQYGTWPLWYIDFVRRASRNIRANGTALDVMKFWGRLGIANGAIMTVPAAFVGVNLGKWAAANSMFYTGGPGLSLLGGMTTLIRGTGSAIFNPDDPFGQSRMTEGSRILQRTARAFIPLHYAVRDIARVVEAVTPTEQLAALLGSQPTQEFTIQQKIDLLENPGRMSTDIEIENRMGDRLTGVEQMDRAVRLAEGSRAARSLTRTQPPPTPPTPVRPPSPALSVNAEAPVPGLPAPILAPAESEPIIP